MKWYEPTAALLFSRVSASDDEVTQKNSFSVLPTRHFSWIFVDVLVICFPEFLNSQLELNSFLPQEVIRVGNTDATSATTNLHFFYSPCGILIRVTRSYFADHMESILLWATGSLFPLPIPVFPVGRPCCWWW